MANTKVGTKCTTMVRLLQFLQEILYRKGTENDSDALSRRPDLHHEIVAYEDLVQEKDLEIGNEFFSSMYHMLVDEDFVQQIVSSYPLDPAYGGISIPRGTHLNDHDGLYYFGDKVCIPKNPSIIDQLMYEAHSAQGHPSYERTLANLSKSFWWPRMAKQVKQYVLQIVCYLSENKGKNNEATR